MRYLKPILLSALGILAVCSLALALSNPSLAAYRQSILSVIAEQEAHRQAQSERAAIEHEAAALKSYFAAVHYDGSRLDIATIQNRFPKLGRSLITQPAAISVSLHERLSQMKEQALHRITVTRETALYSLKADLAAHSVRTSYGLWSHFSTCYNGRLVSYLALAGQFHEEDSGTCAASR